MSIGARFGCFVLLAALASSALAQENAGGSPNGTWQDPPTRSAADKQPQTADKPAPATTESRAERGASGATPRADRRTARRDRPERRRSIAIAEPRRVRVTTASERQYFTHRFSAYRHEPYAYGPVATRRVVEVPARYPLTGLRREGWGPLLRGSREERIADAQAHGFIVLRARTLRGPDGHFARRYTDYDLEDE